LAKLPKFAYYGDACADLFPVPDDPSQADLDGVPWFMGSTVWEGIIRPRSTAIIRLGFSTAIPYGWEAQIRTRSSQGFNYGIRVHPGTIDAGFRNEWSVKVFNLGDELYRVSTAVAIAQVAIRPVPSVQFTEVSALPPSERGEKGYGSSDRQGG
jgi:dUTP pyrophosphatase